MDIDEISEHPARIVAVAGVATNSTSKETAAADKLKEHLDKKTEIERAIEITALSAKLEKLKASAGFKEETSAREKLEKSFTEHDAHAMGARTIAKEKRTENAIRFKNDPEGLEEANESVQDWLDRQL